MALIPGPTTAPPLISAERLLELYGARFGVTRFEIIRALDDRSAFVGIDAEGQRRWTIKVGLPSMRSRFARQMSFARQIMTLQGTGQMSQMRVEISGWRRWRHEGLVFLAHPYDPRPEIGPERGLLATERCALADGLPAMLTVLAAFDAAADDFIPTDRFAARYRDVVGGHVVQLRSAGVVCQPLADELADLASRLPLLVPFRPSHGDLTPWHVLADPERPGLIDFEFAALEGPRFEDLSRLVQKIWTCQMAETFARQLVKAGLSRLGVSEEAYWRDAALMLLDRAVKGLFESIAWHADRDSARRHAAWIMRSLGRHGMLTRRHAHDLSTHLLRGCDG